MTQRPRAAVLGIASALLLLYACDRPGADDIMADYEVIPSASVPIEPLSPPSASASIRASASGSVPSPASASSATPPSPPASGSAGPAGSGSSAPAKPVRVWDCGDKGKPDCPMQKWMKSVAGGAVASGDTDRLARAFQAMSRPPPGMGAWAGICATGAAKAQAGDFDGAKAQCKVCHSKYQSAYHSSMRDVKWP